MNFLVTTLRNCRIYLNNIAKEVFKNNKEYPGIFD